ncbi:hypothetical protein Ade02nite_19930 [Paractinoplanes deccanensis]|uniref:Uncharacterized protein n=1 Tax=Paractinoplanes deccanensis TaxID=113561 RepID=A0ABQ3Y023_9ACTN|nr:hypothetical protein [Actinoplanes deccanensis]GID73352.1 hypothetical protein Ade02nite_19930 [Actinoplanes deccanensis]
MWWGAEPPAAPPAWQTWLPAVLGTVIAAAIGAAATVVVARMKRRLDEATTAKTVAESRKAEAETVSVEVATARSLIAEIKAMMADQRADYESRLTEVRVRHEGDVKALTERVSGVEDRERQLRAAIGAHSMWDSTAVAALRATNPDFPEPPPINLD